MKKILAGIIIGLLAGGVGMWSYLHHAEHAEKGEEKKEEKKEESHVQHGTNGETFLKFGKEAQEKMGLKTAALDAAELAHEVKAFGRIIDPAPISTALSDIALASAQVEGSKREYDRLKLLFGQNQNVSARALETAEVTLQRDGLALEAARVRFEATWGPAVTKMNGLDKFVAAAIAQKAALIRVDLLPGDSGNETPTAARIAPVNNSSNLVPARLLGAAVAVDPLIQGKSFLFVAEATALPANASVVAWLSLPGETEKGVVVPRDAVVRHEGETFVYVQAGDETFERKELELEHPLAAGWFTGELKPNAKVVVAGAQQLLSEEFKGAEGE